MGIQQLKRINQFQEKRETLARIYDERLAHLPIQLPPRYPQSNEYQHAWHLYPIVLTDDAKISRDELILKMAERNIGCSVHFIPLHRQPIWRDTYDLKTSDYPIADALFLNEVSIPLYTKMTDLDQDRVIAGLNHLLA